MTIMRVFRGKDGESHFEDVYPRFEPRGDQSETAELIPGSGIIIRRFDPKRMNPWHNAPGHYVVFTVSGAVDIEIGDGTVKRLGPGDILIAEDLTGRGHITRAVGRGTALAWNESLADDVRLEMPPWDTRKPVIASVQGHCLGGGCEMVMMCDVTVAADDALFGEPEIRFSNVGPALVMPFIVGLKRARELLYLGDPIDAQTALAWGMVNRVVPRADLQAATLKFARRLALISPEALASTKLAINRGADAAGFRNAIRAGLDVLAALYAARTDVGMKFDEIREKEGLAAALRWRAAQVAG